MANRLNKKTARSAARATARELAGDLRRGGGRRRQARRVGRIVGRTVAKKGTEAGLSSEEMAVAAQRATERAIGARVKEGESFRKQNRDRLTKQEAKTVRRHKKDNVKSAATSSAKFAVKQLYDGTPMRNDSIAKILGI